MAEKVDEFQTVVGILGSQLLSRDEMEEIYYSIQSALYSDDYWRGEKPYTIVVGDKVFSMRPKGRDQLALIGRLSEFLENELAGVFESLDGSMTGTVENLRALASLVDPEILVSLGTVITGEDKEFISDHFDIDWIVGAAEMLYHANQSIKRLLSRFFTR